jgi:hypothetical protein
MVAFRVLQNEHQHMLSRPAHACGDLQLQLAWFPGNVDPATLLPLFIKVQRERLRSDCWLDAGEASRQRAELHTIWPRVPGEFDRKRICC